MSDEKKYRAIDAYVSFGDHKIIAFAPIEPETCEACSKELVDFEIADNMSLCNSCQSSLQD